MRPRTNHRDSPPAPSLRTSLLLSAMLFSTLAAFGLLAHALPNAPDAEGRTPRQIAIEKGIAKQPNHAWAGNYFRGYGLLDYVWIKIAPEAGVAAEKRHDIGSPIKNEGNILQQPDGSLHFAFASPNDSLWRHIEEDVRPVQWGKRRYLIPDAAMMEFVNAINAGEEPRVESGGFFLMREGDEQLAADGLPSLLEQYAKLIRREPVEFAIQAIRPQAPRKEIYCLRPFQLLFDTRGDSALAVGSQLRASSDRGYKIAKVISVHGARAVAEVAIEAGLKCEEPVDAPTLRWRLKTGALGVKWPASEGCYKPGAGDVVESR